MARDVVVSEGVIVDEDGNNDFTLLGDLTVKGQMRTGLPFEGGTYDRTKTVFGGIESEGRVLGAGALATPSGTVTFDDGVPRIVMPDATQTDIYATFALEEWWLAHSLGMYIEWSNDHSALGNVRWQFELKEFDIATQKLSQGGVVATKTTTHDGTGGTPSVNGGTTTTTCFSKIAGDTIAFNPGPFASFYVCRITRLGADAADTLAGPIGLIEFSYVRGQ